MGLLAPSALLFGLLAVPIIALYLLRLRGSERRVSSTFLWRRIVRDIEANTLWQRLRRNLLLFLQLLALAALVLALARPYFLGVSGIQGDLVLVLDASASMQATDVAPSRFSEARQTALRLIDQLPPVNVATVIRMGDVPEVLVAQSRDRGRVRRVIAEARPTAGGANLDSALSLAASVVRGERPAQVVVLSDGNVTSLQPLGLLPFELRHEPIGDSASNAGIAAFSTRHTEAGTDGLARIVNYGQEARTISLHLSADGSLYDVRDFEVAGGADRTVRWSSLPGAAVLELRLIPGDTFALDDQAWATGGSGDKVRALLVSEGNHFLEKALSLQPGIEVARAAPDSFSPEGDYDLWVFDGLLPPVLPNGAMLALDPPVSAAAWVSPAHVRVQSTRPGRDEMLRYADLSNVHVREAVPLLPPPEARVLLDSDRGPLLAAWEEPGRRIVAFAFDLHDSDLPLQPAFPILVQDLTQWLLPSMGKGPVARPGATVEVPISPEANSAWLETPTGRRVQIAPPFPPQPFLVEEVGPHRVIYETSDGRKTDYFAANLFSPVESGIGPSELPPFEARQELGETSDRVPWELSAWLALAVLIILGAEWYVYSRGY